MLRVLDQKYFAPTGMALGLPLPSGRFATRLHFTAATISEYALLHGGSEVNFQFVPIDSLHITIVNRDHYRRPERITGEISGKLEYLSIEEKTRLQEIISRVGVKAVSVTIERLVLTNGILSAIADSWEQISQIRDAICLAFPTLSVMTPTSAHIKLGHLTGTLTNSATSELKNLVSKQDVRGDLEFHDAYTPVGRIVF